jgi:DnaJ-class molecular chaperone
VDYYGALNVSTAANTSEIKTKYRRLALLYHPGFPEP